MERKDVLSKSLGIIGTTLVWIPILAPIFFSAVFLASEGIFRFDYLMPAELFLVALFGGGLLIWAAFRARSRHRMMIVWGLVAAVLLLLGTQGLAVVTGLASGAAEPVGWRWALVTSTLILFTLALIATGIGGIILLRDLYHKT